MDCACSYSCTAIGWPFISFGRQLYCALVISSLQLCVLKALFMYWPCAQLLKLKIHDYFLLAHPNLLLSGMITMMKVCGYQYSAEVGLWILFWE